MYQALYRKYRPKTFNDVVGQDVIVKTLQNSIKNDMVSHAYLFCGPRGTGKTSIAKIFAKILNCHNLKDLEPCEKCVSCEQANTNQNIDIIEIDAASNNGVDEIREIRNKITLVPANSKYKIYIIDEVHMLSGAAFNALLKTLEEPPSHVIFIFATTEPQKIPMTILSRCQRFDYQRISVDKIVERLKFIVKKEKINIDDDALEEIAKLSDGGMRDSISLLDQTLAYSDKKIQIKDIHDINGTLLKEETDNFILKMLNKDLVGILEQLENYDQNGKNMIKIVQELISTLKDGLIYLHAPSLVSRETNLYQQIKTLNVEDDIYNYIKALSSLINDMRNTSDNKLLLEIELIKMLGTNKQVTEQTKSLEQAVVEPKVETKEQPTEDEESSDRKVVEQEEKPNKTSEKEEKVPKEETQDNEKLATLKKIRINNALCKFSQTERKRVTAKLEELNDFLSMPDFSQLVSLIKDGELKAVSDNYLMFMYKTELMAETFNNNLIEIQELFEQCFYETYYPIAIDLNDWNFIKDDYNKHKEKYVYEEETISLDDIFKENSTEAPEEKNEIAEMFDDIIEYEN